MADLLLRHSLAVSFQMEFRIRPGEPKDVCEIAAFNRRMAQETESVILNSETVLAGVRGMVDHPERGFYLVAETGPANEPFIVAALMVTTEWSDWRNGLFWWIQSVYVLPDFRRRGLYRALYDHVKRLADLDQRVCGFRLYVEKDNHIAQSTYRALGMSETPYRLFEQISPPHSA